MTKPKSPKRYYAFKEYIMYENEELIFFVGLTNSISRSHPNGYQRLHKNIPSWLNIVELMRESFGDFSDIKSFLKSYPIKRSYGKYFTEYKLAEDRFIQLINENPNAEHYNFIHCAEIVNNNGVEEVEVKRCVNSLDISTPQLHSKGQ